MAVHVLACLQRADRRHQVAQARGLLEFQPGTGLLHGGAEFAGQFVAAAVEEQRGLADRFGVVGLGHQAHARPAAAPDLVLQAGPRAVAEHAVLAVADAEQLLHQVQRLAHGGDAGVRAEVAPRHGARAAVERDARPFLASEQHIRIALVVAQQHVVARRQRLDQLVLQQQRFGLGAGDGHVHARHLGQHRLDARRLGRVVEVAGDALAQRAGLAHVQQRVVRRIHAVHARCRAQRGREGLAVEFRLGTAAHSSMGTWLSSPVAIS